MVPPGVPVLSTRSDDYTGTITVVSCAPGTNPIGGYVLFAGYYPGGRPVQSITATANLPQSFPARPLPPCTSVGVYFVEAYDTAMPPNFSGPSLVAEFFPSPACPRVLPAERGFSWLPQPDCVSVQV